MKVLEIEHLTKYYGNVKGVEDLTLSLNQGEIFGFIGPNGAGKSTTIRSIMHLINPNQGIIKVNGKEFKADDIDIKRTIGYLPSENHLYEDETVQQLLDFHEKFYDHIHDRRVALVDYLALDESKKIEDLSLGNLKKVGIILALMHSPSLLILDEPTSGLDPIMQQKFYELILEEKKKGTTIFYSTHILSEISKICDRVGIIKQGHLMQIEEIDSLKNKAMNYVTITSQQIDQMIEDLQLEVIERNEYTMKFKNTMNANQLIKQLINYEIDHILIEEATIEDMFMHFYK